MEHPPKTSSGPLKMMGFQNGNLLFQGRVYFQVPFFVLEGVYSWHLLFFGYPGIHISLVLFSGVRSAFTDKDRG